MILSRCFFLSFQSDGETKKIRAEIGAEVAETEKFSQPSHIDVILKLHDKKKNICTHCTIPRVNNIMRFNYICIYILYTYIHIYMYNDRSKRFFSGVYMYMTCNRACTHIRAEKDTFLYEKLFVTKEKEEIPFEL